MAEVEIDDHKIEQFLKEAEARLAAKQIERNGKSLVLPPKNDVAKKTDKNTAQDESITAAKPDDVSLRIPQPKPSKKEMAEKAKATAGPGWFNLPKTDLTPELRRDLQLLKMRDTMAMGKRFMKKDTSSAIPSYSAVGTMVEGPTDFFSARLTKKERKRTLLEEVLENEDSTRKFKSKYGEIQTAKTSGKKAHYKKMMQKRYGSKK